MDAVKWSGPSDLESLKRYLFYEVTSALNARQPLEQQWRKFLQQYRAPASQATRDIPFLGSSNRVIPVTGTDVDQYYAKFMQSIFADPDLWVVSAMNPDWQDAAKPLQDFLAALDRTVLKMYRVCKPAILEMVKMGTAVLETGWLYEKRPVNTYDADGKVIKVDKVVSQPFVDHVRLVDFLIPPYAYAIDPDEQRGAPWVAKRVEITKEKLLQIATSTEPMLPKIGLEAALNVIAFERRFQQPYDEKVQQLDYQPRAAAVRDTNFDVSNTNTDGTPVGSASVNWIRKIELWEVHVRWSHGQNNPDDGIPSTDAVSPSDLVVLFHLPTQSIIRATYNPYLHGKRPFEVMRFFPEEGFYGIGVCEMDEVFQAMESEYFNNLADGTTLANTFMLAAKEGGSLAPGEPWFAGKLITTQGNPNEEVMRLNMGNGAYPGLENIIEMVQNQRKYRNGVGDIQTGNVSGLPGRTTATTVQTLLAEGNKRPDLTLKDMRYEGLSIVGLRMIQLCQQFIGSPVDMGGKRYLQMAMDVLGTADGSLAVAKLKTPLENAELGLGVEISAASATGNKDLQKQQMVALITLTTQIAPQIIQMVQAATQGAGTPVGVIAAETAKSLSNLMVRAYEQYDIHDASHLVPDAAQALATPAVPQGGGGAGAQLGAGQGGQPASGAPGVATLPLGTANVVQTRDTGLTG